MSMHFTGQLPLAPVQRPERATIGHYSPNLKVTALGGGHGLYATLSALRLISGEITAIVTVADDGGSSGVIRQEMDVIPPGDLRMALAALCDDTDWGRTWRDTMQHRFKTSDLSGEPGTLDNHALGNLLIVALWELLGDPVDGLAWAGALLGARGVVLPMSTTPMTISGTVLADEDGQLTRRSVTGQAKLAKIAGAGRVSHIELSPANAPATPQALDAIELTDWIIIGPGSWYTSVLPHLLLEEQRAALDQSTAKRCLVMNLQPSTTETQGMSAAEHLSVLHYYAPEFRIDVIIADPTVVTEDHAAEFSEAAEKLGATVVFSKVKDEHRDTVHDPLRLAVAFSEAFDKIPS
ncbi:MAG: YvcK family protein [Yaniella sp.]|uniref:gluconeogenesis factor YvcK family protein n=1 Tax=Yaniella sp. TaxID=2773929 RepID=UPI002649196C|nr:gluconeogenesis factor YvcK family protein [Yaniella sp.]MDN5704501.1 YvcK family protein [Yaniella sp.]MDN5731724.1 YvcK family protein [Yaniella sp.]MDN5815559.1 YvcK family protein [Yaniella sp.]MDN5818149.1 YvcK family protein [Yaniella sp.]MDN5838405.1 YvcK family protein [Yaniella sp.]